MIGPETTARSIWVCLAAYFLAESLSILGGQRCNRAARAAWTVGLAALLVHIASAYHFQHAWSHAAAVETTARRTADVVGFRFGQGIYFNFLFALAWAADAAWWWVDPPGRAARPAGLSLAIEGFFALLFVSGAIVFESGPVRWFALAGYLALAALVCARGAARQR